MIPIKPVKGIEAQANFEGISTPKELADMLSRLLAVDDEEFTNLEEVIVSPLEPIDTDKKKIWIKSSGAPAIGLPIGGRYRLIYSYPPDVPFLWIKGLDSFPNYLRKLSSGELSDYDLANPSNPDYFYVILNP